LDYDFKTRVTARSRATFCSPILFPTTLKLSDFARTQTDIEARLKSENAKIATGIEWELSTSVRPERLDGLQFANSTDSSHESHRKAEIQRVLRWMDTSKSNVVLVVAQLDRTDAVFGIRRAVPNVIYQPRKQGIRIFGIQPKDDELRMLTRLHQADGIKKWRFRIIHISSVPSVLANDVSDFLVHHASKANVCVNAVGALDYAFKTRVIARSRSTHGYPAFLLGKNCRLDDFTPNIEPFTSVLVGAVK
jgi:hypothetical protein